MNSAEKLQKLRKARGLTQEKLLEQLPFKLSLSALRNYENVKNPRIPTRDILQKLADFYNVDIGYIVDDSIDNTTRENINLNRELKLTDNSINILKTLKNPEIFNLFLENIDINALLGKTEKIYIMQEILMYAHVLNTWLDFVEKEDLKMDFTDFEPKIGLKDFSFNGNLDSNAKYRNFLVHIHKASFIQHCVKKLLQLYTSLDYELLKDTTIPNAIDTDVLYLLRNIKEFSKKEDNLIRIKIKKRLKEIKEKLNNLYKSLRSYQYVEAFKTQNIVNNFNNWLMMIQITEKDLYKQISSNEELLNFYEDQEMSKFGYNSKNDYYRAEAEFFDELK